MKKEELNELYTLLSKLETEACGICDMDCPYYVNGNYGKECALEIVMTEVSTKLHEA